MGEKLYSGISAMPKLEQWSKHGVIGKKLLNLLQDHHNLQANPIHPGFARLVSTTSRTLLAGSSRLATTPTATTLALATTATASGLELLSNLLRFRVS